MNRVFVLGSTQKPLMPCRPARARELLKKGKAAVYRTEPCWANRARRPNCGGKWLAPSVKSRVDNVSVWFGRLDRLSPVACAEIETVRFDTQKLQNPEIDGFEYQRGTLHGFEVKEYLLEKWHRECAYCGKEGVPLQIEHIVPKASGGGDRVSNLTLACRPCNEEKAAQPVERFLAGKPDLLKKIKARAKAPLRDAAAVNSARHALGNAIKAFGLETRFWSGGRTKMNRTAQGYAKDHFTDAACVGETGAAVHIPPGFSPLQIKATGRGSHQVVRTDKYGFPRNGAGRCKRVRGFQTGDLVRLGQPSGKYAGTHTGRLAGIRADGRFDIKAAGAKITSGFKNFTLIQRGDGYGYAH